MINIPKSIKLAFIGIAVLFLILLLAVVTLSSLAKHNKEIGSKVVVEEEIMAEESVLSDSSIIYEAPETSENKVISEEEIIDSPIIYNGDSIPVDTTTTPQDEEIINYVPLSEPLNE